MSIGIRIKEARIKAGISQEALAKAIGSTKQAVYKYEAGIVTNIPMDKIEIMATVLSVTPAYLMGWEEEPTPINEGLTEDERFWVDIYRKVSPEVQELLIKMAGTMGEQSEEARQKLVSLLEAALQMRGLM